MTNLERLTLLLLLIGAAVGGLMVLVPRAVSRATSLGF